MQIYIFKVITMKDETTVNFRKRFNIYSNKKVLNIIMKDYLTTRQYVVACEILIYNKTEKDVADMLGISQPTVSRHLNNAIKTIKHYEDFLNKVINL